MTTSGERKDKVLSALDDFYNFEAKVQKSLRTLFNCGLAEQKGSELTVETEIDRDIVILNNSGFKDAIKLIAKAKVKGYSLEQVLEVADLFIRAALNDRPVTGFDMLDDKRFAHSDVLKESNLAMEFEKGGMAKAVNAFVELARTKIIDCPQKWDKHINTWIREQLRASISEFYKDPSTSYQSHENTAKMTPDVEEARSVEVVQPVELMDTLNELDRISILRIVAAQLQLEIGRVTKKIFSESASSLGIGQHANLFIAQEVLLEYEKFLVHNNIVKGDGIRTRVSRSVRATFQSERPRLLTVNTSDPSTALNIRELRDEIKDAVKSEMAKFIKKLDDLSDEALREVQAMGGKMSELELVEVKERIARNAINTRDESILEMIVDANLEVEKRKEAEAVIIPK